MGQFGFEWSSVAARSHAEGFECLSAFRELHINREDATGCLLELQVAWRTSVISLGRVDKAPVDPLASSPHSQTSADCMLPRVYPF